MSTRLPPGDIAAQLTSEIPSGVPTGTRPPAGASVAVSAPGLRWATAAGHARLAGDGVPATPMTPHTHHDLASVTKVAATVPTIMRLASERQLSLDDTVGSHIAAFTRDGKGNITLRDLLLHRGGLWEWQPLYLTTTDPTDALRAAAELPLRYQPGSGRHYSDIGFMLLGSIISTVAGMPLDAAVRQLVSEPLGLSSTRFGHPGGDDVAASSFGDRTERRMIDSGEPYPVSARSSEFSGWRQEPLVGEANDGNAFHAFGGIAGHAGLFSTSQDLLVLAEAFSNFRDHESLWSAEIVGEFFAEGPDAGQSLGFRRYRMAVGPQTMTVLGHTGFVGCAIGFVPERNIAVALASNRLLTHGTPVPTDWLWEQTLNAAGRLIHELSDIATPEFPASRRPANHRSARQS